MSDWIPSAGNPGYIEKTIQRGLTTIIILRPVLSNEEAAKREGNTRTALEGVMREYLHRKEVNHGEHERH